MVSHFPLELKSGGREWDGGRNAQNYKCVEGITGGEGQISGLISSLLRDLPQLAQ